jgi:predicted site-specific integrase-resolvase
MSEHKPVYRYSERKFAEALDLDIRTIKRYVAAGKIRSVKLSARCRRLEDPADFQARQAGESAR